VYVNNNNGDDEVHDGEITRTRTKTRGRRRRTTTKQWCTQGGLLACMSPPKSKFKNTDFGDPISKD
jgi:hypothetical protein